MRDKWYGDNRDLVKWSIILHLAEVYKCKRILQIAYYRKSHPSTVVIDDANIEIPEEVHQHFRNIKNIELIKSDFNVNVFCKELAHRHSYLNQACKYICRFSSEKCIVFLDPDTGLEPANPNLNHVLDQEAKIFWETIKSGDVFVFYQHQTNRNGQPWMDTKKRQLANAIGIHEQNVKIASGPDVAKDVALFYLQKS